MRERRTTVGTVRSVPRLLGDPREVEEPHEVVENDQDTGADEAWRGE